MYRLFALLPLLFLALPAQGAAQNAAEQESIRVQDTPTPDASTFGMDSTRFPHVSYAGSTPQQVSTLLAGIPAPLGSGVEKDILTALMMMPVYPDSADAIPPGWFLVRVDKMIRLGAYADALRLVGSLPDGLRDEATTRRYVDLALTLGDLDTACTATTHYLDQSNKQVDGYWNLRQAFCHRVAGEDDKAELMLGIYSEQYPGQQPLAYSLLSNWGNSKEFLPPYSSADGESVPLLVACLKHSKTSKATERLSAGFITEQEVPGMTPALASALAERGVFAYPLRLKLAALAVASGAADATVLRELLEQAKPSQALPLPLQTQAALLSDINSSQSAENKISAVVHALAAFKQDYTPYVARGIVSRELETFTRSPDSYPLTPELTLDMAAYYIERNNSSSARDVQRYLERRASQDEAFRIALASVRSALYYNRLLGGEETEAGTVPEFTTPQRAELMWALRRLVMVQQALGEDVPAASVSLAQTAPLADTLSPTASTMLALEEAEKNGRSGELLLLSLQLLGDGKLAFVSDEVFARCIRALQQAELTSYAAALAQAAILNPPFAALRSGGTLVGEIRP